MIKIEIPGWETLEFFHLVLDFNGTIARDGHIHNKVKDAICLLGKKVTIHVLTADTRGDVAEATRRLPVVIEKLEGTDTSAEKAAFVRSIGRDHVIAIGNGINDRFMRYLTVLLDKDADIEKVKEEIGSLDSKMIFSGDQKKSRQRHDNTSHHLLCRPSKNHSSNTLYYSYILLRLYKLL